MDCSPNKQPVLLIHGWGGPDKLAEDTMGFAQLYSAMHADGYKEGCNLFYATGVKDTHSRGENMAAIQASLRSAYDWLATHNPNWRGHFDIIGHSYGGLNARFYLESQLYADDSHYGRYGIHVDNLFTLGSPHGGMSLALRELYPGAAMIALGHVITTDIREWLSAVGLLDVAMDFHNFSHQQPANICYRFIGGHFMLQSNVPLVVRTLYAPFETWTWSVPPLPPSPNDIGVSLRSARWLGINPLLESRYPKVLVDDNTDMHGYAAENPLGIDLSKLRSYVKPDTTYKESIRDFLGRAPNQCLPSGPYSDRAATVDAASGEPVTQPVLLASGLLTENQRTSGTWPADWVGQSVVYVSWTQGDLNLVVRDPAGAVWTPASAGLDPNVEYGKLQLGSAAVASYVITNTLTGTWTYTVTASTGPYPIPFDLYVTPKSSLTLAASTPDWLPLGSPAVITASLRSAGAPVTDATVQAQITQPDGSKEIISLYDNGLAPDHTAGDGAYSGTYNNTWRPGAYFVVAQAQGLQASLPYLRRVEANFLVGDNNALLSGSYTSEPRDGDSDGQYEYLDVSADVQVNRAGSYALSAVLEGAGGKYIDLANSSATLIPGIRQVVLHFSGQAIRDSGLDGPYTVSQVLLLDNESFSKLDAADDVLTTIGYDHRLFGKQHFPVFLPLVLR